MSDFNIIPQVIAAMHKGMAKLVAETAEDVAAKAVANAPEASGFMASTIYTQTATSSTYGQNVESPPEDSYLLDKLPAPTGDQEANIGVAANYGEYVELGTVHMAAQPFLAPAAESASSDFMDTATHMEDLITQNM